MLLYTRLFWRLRWPQTLALKALADEAPGFSGCACRVALAKLIEHVGNRNRDSDRPVFGVAVE